MKTTLDVYFDAKRVGTLWADRHGEMRFEYALEWLEDSSTAAISVSLPKQKEAYGRRACRPFFDGLLPEGVLRARVAKTLGVSKGNEFKLLAELGGDVAGALSLWPQGTQPVAHAHAAPKPLSDHQLAAMIDQLPTRPLWASKDGLRLSLAGAQPKVPVVLVKDRVALPALGQPTTHILKPALAGFAAMVENEAFAMTLAAGIPLDVATVSPRHVQGRTFLLIARYDRASNGRSGVQRLHQEDFCQALGVLPERKYASEGGPTFKDLFGLVRTVCARPAQDVLKLLDAAIFNVIVGNADAHGKNFSLLYQNGDVALAPLYDLVCTAAYPSLSKTLAMKIGGAASLANLSVKHWEHFARDVGLSVPFIKKRVSHLAQRVLEQLPWTLAQLQEQGLDDVALEGCAHLIALRAERVESSATHPKSRLRSGA